MASRLEYRSHERDRGGQAEETVSIVSDTYNDSRRNYVLRVTALGMQEDGIKNASSTWHLRRFAG